MGRKLGYEGYTPLGYYRMKRNCYTKEDVESFRAAVPIRSLSSMVWKNSLVSGDSSS